MGSWEGFRWILFKNSFKRLAKEKTGSNSFCGVCTITSIVCHIGSSTIDRHQINHECRHASPVPFYVYAVQISSDDGQTLTRCSCPSFASSEKLKLQYIVLHVN